MSAQNQNPQIETDCLCNQIYYFCFSGNTDQYISALLKFSSNVYFLSFFVVIYLFIVVTCFEESWMLSCALLVSVTNSHVLLKYTITGKLKAMCTLYLGPFSFCSNLLLLPKGFIIQTLFFFFVCCSINQIFPIISVDA